MKKSILIPLVLFFIYIAGSVSAQLVTNNLVHYSQMDGTIIYDILADHQGKIWMATQNGLVNFDGNEFLRFFPSSDNPASIGNLLTYSLYEDKYGRIWIGGMEGLDVYDPDKNSFRHYTISGLTDFPAESQPLVSSIVSDAYGRIFFGINSGYSIEGCGALLYYDPDDDRVKRFSDEKNHEIKNVIASHTDRKGNLWFFCFNGLFKLDKDGHIEKYPYIENLVPDRVSLNSISGPEWESLVWVAGNSFISCYSPLKDTFYSFSLQYLFDSKTLKLTNYSIIRDENENLWIGTDHGLIFYDRKQNRFEKFAQESIGSIGHAKVKCLQFDSFGNLWIGTDSEGLLKYNNGTAFKSIIGSLNESSVLKSGWISNIEESRDGDIWFTSIGDGENAWQLYELNPLSFILKRYDYRSITSLFSNIFTFIELNPGRLMIWTDQGIFDYYPHIGKVEKRHISGFTLSDGITDFFRDRSGNLWILTFEGLFLIENDSVAKKYDLKQARGGSSGSKAIYLMAEQSENNFWLVTNDGLFHFDHNTDRIERVCYDKALGDVFLSQDINSLYAGQDSIIWVGTWMGGLSRYDLISGEVKTYTTGDGLPSMSIQGILSDDNNEVLWLSTFEGLSRFDIENERFDNFSMEDGIHGSLFAEYTYLKTTKGLCLFGGNNGITFFYPQAIEKNSIPPNVYITDFKVADKRMPLRTTGPEKGDSIRDSILQLKFFQNNISIKYTGIHYSNPSRNKFVYKLENYDDSWREVGNQRTAYYYNLPAGQYKFHVKAANSNGVWNETGASLEFIITPPWWRSWWAYIIYGLMLLSVIFVLDRAQRRRVILRERALAREKELAQAREIETAYRELKSAQAQLIHAEKMASLGQLTAGIAHEIQNPLNFVNNFSELSIELMDEIEPEIRKGRGEMVQDLAADLKDNLQKINFHGKRASSIVKGMLGHSRSSSGSKELTDINSLAEEYVRLAYHGLRARDRSFNARFKTDLGENIPEINVVPQEIGRVFLNLINNAFYAVSEKSKQSVNGYEPLVIVSTRKRAANVEVRIKDNGDGIPAHLLDKIFQPFFTTKPAGEGTGLGLSLSYDIITKGHQGEMKVETKEGEGTEFIVIFNADIA